MDVLPLRDKYIFKAHQSYSKIENHIEYRQEEEPILRWDKKVELVPVLKEADLKVIDGV